MGIPFTIERDDLTDPAVHELLNAHLDDVRHLSPPESTHALDIEQLKQPDITFWIARNEQLEVLGCGALRELDRDHGEIKSMRTDHRHLRKGVAAAILQHIINEARQRSYVCISLETGAQEQFVPARTMYANAGFVECAPFGDYREDRNSICMTLNLARGNDSPPTMARPDPSPSS